MHIKSYKYVSILFPLFIVLVKLIYCMYIFTLLLVVLMPSGFQGFPEACMIESFKSNCY